MTTHTLKLKPDQFLSYMVRLQDRFPRAAMRGAMRGALRAVLELQRRTSLAPPANPQQVGGGGAFNTGHYKRSWKAVPTSSGADVLNTAGYAAVIEHGRRPGSRFPPLGAIQAWARRRLGLSQSEAKAAAFPIARAIARRGLVGRKVLTNSIPQIEAWFLDAVQKELERELATP